MHSMNDQDKFAAAISTEEARLLFITDRDGAEAALQFAKRTLKMYRAALFNHKIDRHWAREKEYSFSYIASCVVFRRMINEFN